MTTPTAAPWYDQRRVAQKSSVVLGKWLQQRPGAQDALAHPSRIGDRLHYRDGRVTDLKGTPI